MLSGHPWRPCSRTYVAKHIAAYTHDRSWKSKILLAKFKRSVARSDSYMLNLANWFGITLITAVASAYSQCVGKLEQFAPHAN